MNLGRSQADWSKLFREKGLFLGPIRLLEDVARKLSFGRGRN